jgi:hypothetical protein
MTMAAKITSAGWGIAMIAAFLGPCAAAAQIAAVTTPGRGNLTMCRDWFLYNACDTYHHVALPKRVAVGDQIKLVFGHSDKEYDFRVVGIDRTGTNCTIRSPHTGPQDSGEKIVVKHCAPVVSPAAAP